jgi:hypothetical protein
MEKKTFQEQLAEKSKSLGLEPGKEINSLNRKYIDLTRQEKKFKIKISKQWIFYGKNCNNDCLNQTFYYSEIDNVCSMLEALFNDKKISEEELFYSYVGFLKKSGQNCHLHENFCKNLTKAVVLISYDLNNKKYHDAIESVKHAINKEELERLKNKYDKSNNSTNAIKPIKKTIRIIEEIKKTLNIPVIIEHPELKEKDVLLALSWNENFLDLKTKLIEKKITLNEIIEKYSKDYHLGRLLSARAAEIASKIFYEKYGFKVKDVSLQQLENNQLYSDWKNYDLDIEQYCNVDIKNSRRSKNSPERYVEHCVGKFKKNKSGENIKIAGTLSHYLWVKDIMSSSSDMSKHVIFLGEFDENKLIQLKEYFQNDFLELNFQRFNNDNKFFFPPWIFDLPKFVYAERNKYLSKIKLEDFDKFIMDPKI